MVSIQSSLGAFLPEALLSTISTIATTAVGTVTRVAWPVSGSSKFLTPGITLVKHLLAGWY